MTHDDGERRLLLGAPPDLLLTAAEAEEQMEWETDRLVELVAARAARDPRSAYWTDHTLLAWESRDSVVGHAWSAAKVEAAARSVAGAVLASRWQLALYDETRRARPAAVSGVGTEVLEHAARSRCAMEFDLAVAAGNGRELWDEPCARWVALPRGVPRGKYVALAVSGDSMVPLLAAGDVVLVRVGGRVCAGRIVVARDPDAGYVVKALAALRARTLELHSTNPAYGPRVIPRTPLAVLGTVIGRWRGSSGRGA